MAPIGTRERRRIVDSFLSIGFGDGRDGVSGPAH